MTFDFEETRTKATARKNVLAARLQEIPKEKARLDEEEKEIQVEMVALDQIIDGVSYMEAGELPDDFEELGFRGQIERILSENSPNYMLPTEIRGRLETAGIKGSTPRNLLISIHTILGRLDKDKLIETKEQNGRTAYRWKVEKKAEIAGLHPFADLGPRFPSSLRSRSRRPGVGAKILWGTSGLTPPPTPGLTPPPFVNPKKEPEKK